ERFTIRNETFAARQKINDAAANAVFVNDHVRHWHKKFSRKPADFCRDFRCLLLLQCYTLKNLEAVPYPNYRFILPESRNVCSDIFLSFSLYKLIREDVANVFELKERCGIIVIFPI